MAGGGGVGVGGLNLCRERGQEGGGRAETLTPTRSQKTRNGTGRSPVLTMNGAVPGPHTTSRGHDVHVPHGWVHSWHHQVPVSRAGHWRGCEDGSALVQPHALSARMPSTRGLTARALATEYNKTDWEKWVHWPWGLTASRPAAPSPLGSQLCLLLPSWRCWGLSRSRCPPGFIPTVTCGSAPY